MTFNEYTYTVPSQYMTAIFNNDLSGLSDSEIGKLNQFSHDIENFTNGRVYHWSQNSNDYNVDYFTASHDMIWLNVLPCNCTDIILNVAD